MTTRCAIVWLLIALAVAACGGGAQGQILVTGRDTFFTVDLPLNGVQTTFAIATGQERSLVDPATAAALGLTDTGTTFPSIPSVDIDVPLYSGFFDFGDEDIPYDFGVTDALTSVLNLPDGVTGILGAGFLASDPEFSLTGSNLHLNPDFTIVSVDGDNRLFVDITIKGADDKTTTVRMLVDTGAQCTLVSTAKADAAKLTDTKKNVKLSGAISGLAPIKSGTLDDLGSVNFRVCDTIGLPKDVSGIIGIDVLGKSFKVDGKTLTITTSSGGGTSGAAVHIVNTIPVPEPSSLLTLALGAPVVLALRRRRQ